MEIIKGFGSDNHSGIHPLILKALIEENVGHSPSYGTDDTTHKAQELFKSHFGNQAEIFFVFNGTAANVLCLASMMKSYESVLCSDMAHLHMDECGAPEKFIGCKVIPIKSKNGKIDPEGIKAHLVRLGDQHFSQPKVISITQPTEVGTLYSLDELSSLAVFAKTNQLKLHIDGARFIYAPQALNCSFKDIIEAAKPDAISFGGTKNGLLFGEAVILFNNDCKQNFKFIRKQAMQLPSKNRFISRQFIELLKEPGLYKEIAQHGINMAQYLALQIKPFSEIELSYPVQANSLYVKIPKAWVKPLKKCRFFYVWDEDTWELRWMMSFDTTKDDIDGFIEEIKRLRLIEPSMEILK